jgi:hypothetical protein
MSMLNQKVTYTAIRRRAFFTEFVNIIIGGRGKVAIGVHDGVLPIKQRYMFSIL